MRKILDTFEEQHPGIKVKMQQLNWRDGLDKITTSFAAGTASDVCELGSTWVAQFAESGVLYNLTEHVLSKKSEYIPNLLESVLWNRRYYGIPWVTGTRIFFYNKDLFLKAGLDPDNPPKTWDDVNSHSQKLTSFLNANSQFHDCYPFAIPIGEYYTPWQTFLPIIWSAGGTLFDGEESEILADADINIEVMQFYQNLAKISLLSKQAHIDRNFATGKVAMMVSGGWNFNLIPRLNPNLNYGVSLIPAYKDKSVSFLGSEVLVIFRDTKHPKESQLLVDYLTSAEVQLEIVKVVPSFIPCTKQGVIDSYHQANPFRKIFIEQLSMARTPPAHPKWSKIQNYITQAIEESLFQNKPPKVVLHNLKYQIDNLMIDYRGISGSNYYKSIGYIVFIAVFGLLSLIMMFNIMKVRRQDQVLYKKTFQLYIFLLPWIMIFIVFYLYPFIYSFVLSFTDYSPLKGYTTFCGLRNYITVFHDPEFRKALLNTFIFAIGTCTSSLLLALFCAMIIYRKVFLYRWLQMGLFAPISISVIVAASMFSYFYSSEGIFNMVLDFLHLPRPLPDNWLINPRLALVSVMIMNVWSTFGLYMVIFTAGLHAIPRELYEASLIDGITSWQRFRHITLPQLKPFILLVIVLNTVKSFQVFPEIFAMTQGGPHGATITLVYYLYKTGFNQFEMGKASAVGYILLGIIGIFSIIEVYYIRKENVYEG
ncbi:MAG: extracellular solute-binding protein [Candidatus Auribacterota bacterium]|nr:extracellular solute-binding protein [Candidatus Auribacterota bacterium]